MKIPKIPVEKAITLPEIGTWPKAVHIFDEQLVNALEAAMAAQRPLLVRGEPGTGKSQLARAAAFQLGRLFVSEVVSARTESQDLQYHFDAVARLAEAQAIGAAKDQADIDARLDHQRFLSPGALWWVFDWASALEQYQRCRLNLRRPEKPSNWKPEHGAVLLIDEIDKAEVDVPNGLLEILGNGAFSVPWRDQRIGLAVDIPAPLVIVTTNEERELPPAFVLRCLVLHLSVPEEEPDFIKAMTTRGEAHFGKKITEKVLREAARQLFEDRQEASKQGLTPPGQAEYLDLLRAICNLSNNKTSEKVQMEILEKISVFVMKKYI